MVIQFLPQLRDVRCLHQDNDEGFNSNKKGSMVHENSDGGCTFRYNRELKTNQNFPFLLKTWSTIQYIFAIWEKIHADNKKSQPLTNSIFHQSKLKGGLNKKKVDSVFSVRRIRALSRETTRWKGNKVTYLPAKGVNLKFSGTLNDVDSSVSTNKCSCPVNTPSC